MIVISPRLAAKARSSAGTKTGKLSAIERLATPSTKQSATSNHGTKRVIKKFPSHDRTLASAAPPRQVPRRGGFRVEKLVIPPGCNGPRLSGNGGYVGGVVAAAFSEKFGGDGTVEITLRAPVPIDRAMRLVPESNALMLRDGETLICEARA